MSAGGTEFTINTGNPQLDQQTLAQTEQGYRAAGMSVSATPMPGGGFHVRVGPAGQAAPAQQGWQQQPQAQQPHAQQGWQQQQPQGGYGAAAAYGGGAAMYQGAQPGAQPGMMDRAAGAVAEGMAALGQQRVAYLRKVYSLLTGACFVAIAAGWISLNIGPTVAWEGVQGETVNVPWMVSAMMSTPAGFWLPFGILVAATFVASWVSKVPYVNIAALFGVGAIMGVQLAPMIFVATYFAGVGDTLTAHPVRDAGIMTAACFIGITGYVFVTRKDFSYLKAILNIGFWVVLAGCIMTFFLQSEIFALAIASAGALLSAGFLLYVTSYIFKHSDMDDAVGDALAILVQLRNLFMFLLRIFMSSRR